jgi:hypothetical protein
VSDQDREAFDSYIVSAGTKHWGQEVYDEHWKTWQASRNHYAPKLTEAEAVQKTAEAIRLTPKKRVTAYRETRAAADGDGSDMTVTHEITNYVEDREAQAKAALRAAGVRFKDEP